jgi:hypothetical protein
MTSVAGALCESEPLAPVMVSAKLPVATAPVVVMRSVEGLDPDTDAGVNVAVAPAGNPATLKVTKPEKLFCGVTVALKEVLAPRTMVRDAGLTASEKSGAALMTSVADALCESEPLAPVMVSV